MYGLLSESARVIVSICVIMVCVWRRIVCRLVSIVHVCWIASFIKRYEDEALIEGEGGLKSLAPPTTADMIHLTSLYEMAADNMG